MKLKLLNYAFSAFLLFASLSTFSQKLSVYDLKIEHQTNPLAVDAQSPRFSWKIKSSLKNTLQTNYQIRVASDKDNLKSGKNLQWKAIVKSDQSVLIPYNGDVLKSKTSYFWQVRIKDNHGNTSAWSEINFWQTGLKTADWSAKWITVGTADTSSRNPLLRKVFTAHKTIKKALIYATAKGLYQADLNGVKVSDSYFAPGWTSYKNHIQYQVYDVTGQIRKGANAIGVTLANGWYKGRIGFGNQHKFYGDTRALLLQLELEYADGSKQTINSDDTWKYAYGAIMASDIYDGETYDARHEKNGWTSPNYSENAEWSNVRVIPGGTEKLVSMSGPPVKKHEEFKALKVFKTPKGETVVDFGQNLVGWVMLKASGAPGTKITLSHAEVLDKEGNFYIANLRSAKAQAVYVLGDKQEQIFQQNFTFQGFKYVKVEGFPGELKPEHLKAVALYSDMPITGKFSTSNKLVNQLQHNIQWGQRGNFLDVPTDCPQRDERLGWTGDAQAFANTAAYNMDVAGFFTKWMKDVKTDQYQNGFVPHVIPDVLRPNEGGSTGWADVTTIVPWDLYMVYGDKGLLETQYESMKKWVGYMNSKAENNLWNTGSHFGDWLFYCPDDDTDGRASVTDKHLIAQTFYANSVQIMVNAAKVLGKTEDEKHYQSLLKDIKTAFVKEYMTSNGRLVSSTQTAYVLALHFDMLSDELRAQAAQRLVDNIRSYGNHLTTGFLGTPYLCHVLTRFGHNKLAYDLLMQQSYPSWLYPVKMGATTIWERWDGIKPNGTFQTPDMNSYNHYAYGAIGDWMYKNLAGITAALPGYKAINIAPKPGGGITSANGELNTVYGIVSSSWKIENGLFKLDVEVPANTNANITLPASTEKIKVGSGSYHYECKI